MVKRLKDDEELKRYIHDLFYRAKNINLTLNEKHEEIKDLMEKLRDLKQKLIETGYTRYYSETYKEEFDLIEDINDLIRFLKEKADHLYNALFDEDIADLFKDLYEAFYKQRPPFF